MMVVVSYLRMAGFFALATERIAARFSRPMTLLAVTIGISGLLSAFLVNDVVCVALTPLVLHLCQRLKRPPIPYLVGMATASNRRGDCGHGWFVLRGQADRDRGADCGRSDLARAGSTREGVPLRGLAASGHVCRPVRRGSCLRDERRPYLGPGLSQSPVVLVSGLSLFLSNLVSNVPAVLLFKPIMEVIVQKEQAWLALAMSSTLAGYLTVLGSVANLIVVENARRAGTELSFVEYLKVGVPVTLVTTVVGTAWLGLVHY